ncbi:class E sortase [Rubrobacter marinus]|nr:class E sortase [Rubrobacter marinus]
MRIKSTILSLLSLALIGAGVALIASFFLGADLLGNAGGDEGEAGDPSDFNVPVLEESTGAARPEPEGSEEAPEDKTLTVSIPDMEVFEAAVPDARGDDEAKLKDYLGIHLQGTGFPWEDGANVYIAGHRLGYPNTDSFLAFWDLDVLENGDEISVRDADGREYTYRVFKEVVVEPTNLEVTRPVPGKDVLTLQTCTLPDYSRRLIVQAEKVA